MSDKDQVIEAIRKLPETANVQDISEEVAILAAIRRGEKAGDEGRRVPHDEVKRRLAQWLSK